MITSAALTAVLFVLPVVFLFVVIVVVIAVIVVSVAFVTVVIIPVVVIAVVIVAVALVRVIWLFATSTTSPTVLIRLLEVLPLEEAATSAATEALAESRHHPAIRSHDVTTILHSALVGVRRGSTLRVVEFGTSVTWEARHLIS